MSIESLRERAASIREQMNGTTDPSIHASLQRQLEDVTEQIGKDKSIHGGETIGKGERPTNMNGDPMVKTEFYGDIKQKQAIAAGNSFEVEQEHIHEKPSVQARTSKVDTDALVRQHAENDMPSQQFNDAIAKGHFGGEKKEQSSPAAVEKTQSYNAFDHNKHKDKQGVVSEISLMHRKEMVDKQIARGEGNMDGLKRESQLLGEHLKDRQATEGKINTRNTSESYEHYDYKQQNDMRKDVDSHHMNAFKNDPYIKEMNNSWTFKDRLSATVDDIKDKAHEVVGKVKEGLSTPTQDVKPTQQKEKSFSDMLKVEEPKGKGLMDAAKERAGEMYGNLKNKVNSYVEKVCKSDIEKLPLDHEGKTKGHNIADIAKQPAKDYDGHEKALNADISKDRKDGKLDVTDSHQKEAVKEGIDTIKSHDKDMKALGKEINDQGLRGERFSINLEKQAPEIRKDIQREIKEIPRQMEHARDIKR